MEVEGHEKSKHRKKKAEKRRALESEQDQQKTHEDEDWNLPSSSKSHAASPFTSLKESRKQKLSLSSDDIISVHKKKKRKKHKETSPDLADPEVISASEKHSKGGDKFRTDDDSSKGSDTGTDHKKKKKKKKKSNKNTEIENEVVENTLSGEELNDSTHKSKHKKKKKNKNRSKETGNEITLDMLDSGNADSISELADKIANESHLKSPHRRSSTPNPFPFYNEEGSSDVDEPESASKVSSKSNVVKGQSKPAVSSKTKPSGKQKGSSVNRKTGNHIEDADVSEHRVVNSESDMICMDDPAVQEWLKSLEHDMVEEELDFEPPELHRRVPVLKGASAKEKEELKKDGIYIRLGKWSPKEDRIIRDNLESFAKKCNVPASHLLLGINKNTKEKLDSKLSRYLQLKKFSFQLARNLPDRTLFSTYLRARKVFHPMISGKLNEEQKSEMFRLKGTVGHKWTAMSEIMNLPAHLLREAARYHMEKRDTGPWTTEENEKLFAAVEEELVQREHGTFRKLPWKKIAEKVGTRNKGQCCKQWLHTLCWKLCHGNKNKRKWTADDSCRLIEHIYELDAETEADLDWDALYNEFSKSDPPPKKDVPRKDEKELPV